LLSVFHFNERLIINLNFNKSKSQACAQILLVPAKKKKGRIINPRTEEDFEKQVRKRIAAALQEKTTDETSQMNQSSVSYSQYGTEQDFEESSASTYIHTADKLLKL
jgi:hypothetical protein